MAEAAGADDIAKELGDALTQHERVRRTTDLPLFYGEPKRDTITAVHMIQRVERAARQAKWHTDIEKCDQLILSLRGEADLWAKGLEERPNFDITDWEAVKDEFLKAYATKYTPLSICKTLHTLRMKSEDTVQMFHNRVLTTFSQARFNRPATIMQFLGSAEDEDRVYHEGGTERQIPQDSLDKLVAVGATQMEWYLMMVVFVGGLHERIRDKVMQANPEDMEEALHEARKQEMIYDEERKPKGVVVTAVKTQDKNDEEREKEDQILMIDEDEVEQIEAVNAIRRRQNRPQIKYRVRRRCFNCNKPGHIAKNCRLPRRSTPNSGGPSWNRGPSQNNFGGRVSGVAQGGRNPYTENESLNY
jgi:hypothetical protein